MHLVSCGSCDICFQVHLQASNRKWEACDQWPLEDMGYHTGANVYGQRGQTLYTVVKSVLMFFLIACKRNPCNYVKVCQTDLVFISLLFQLLQRKHIITAVSLTRQTKKIQKKLLLFSPSLPQLYTSPYRQHTYGYCFLQPRDICEVWKNGHW